jgi:hypothetical protein
MNNEIDKIKSSLLQFETNNIGSPQLYKNWINHWKSLLNTCIKHDVIGFDGNENPVFYFDFPAKEIELSYIERETGISIPSSFRSILQNFSKSISIQWKLQENDLPPDPFDDTKWGELRWDFRELPDLIRVYNDWKSECFDNPENPYDAIWYNKYPFAEILNGDMLAIDLNSSQGSVVYLSDDGATKHGYHLGNSFEDFITRYSQIGCVGYECWVWEPFAPNGILDPDCENAFAWRKWFGLEINE